MGVQGESVFNHIITQNFKEENVFSWCFILLAEKNHRLFNFFSYVVKYDNIGYQKLIILILILNLCLINAAST